MKIKYLAHASFLLTSEKGTRIAIDPYQSGMGLNYGPISETADILIITHDHPDHNNAAAIKGNPQLVKQEGSKEIKGIKIKGIPAPHDDQGGKQRGKTLIYTMVIDNLRLCDLGDLGDVLTPKQIEEIGPVDILLIPVGGFFTIDAPTASKVCEQLKPRLIIPIHYKTTKSEYPIKGVEEFTKGKKGVKQIESSEYEILANRLPSATEILVLKPALL